jgi:tetratricopeptide (TPR) repeat protein
MKPIQIIIWTVLAYHVLILLLSLGGSISFGYGLGDLGIDIGYFCIFLILVTLNIWTQSAKTKRISRIINFITLTISVLSLFTLTASFTIWRGSEYGWNGEIFYPSSVQKRETFIQDSVSSERLKRLSKKIRNSPNDFDNYLSRGREFYQNQDYLNAIADYKKALEINDTSLVANLEIGLTYWNINDYEKALKYNEKALNQDTSYFIAKHRVKTLKEEIKKHSH